MGKVFIDTNIIIYAREDDDIKKNLIASDLFKNKLCDEFIFIIIDKTTGYAGET